MAEWQRRQVKKRPYFSGRVLVSFVLCALFLFWGDGLLMASSLCDGGWGEELLALTCRSGMVAKKKGEKKSPSKKTRKKAEPAEEEEEPMGEDGADAEEEEGGGDAASEVGAMRLANICTREKFKGTPLVATLELNCAPKEILAHEKFYGKFVLHPHSSTKQVHLDDLIPPDADHNIAVLYSPKTKKNWGFVLQTRNRQVPSLYWDELVKCFDESKNKGDKTAGGACKDVPKVQEEDGGDGGLQEFIKNAVFIPQTKQIYQSGNFLAVMYTEPYKKILKCWGGGEKGKRALKKCQLMILLVDLEAYQQCCSELQR